jgi:hypothetical protein
MQLLKIFINASAQADIGDWTVNLPGIFEGQDSRGNNHND